MGSCDGDTAGHRGGTARSSMLPLLLQHTDQTHNIKQNVQWASVAVTREKEEVLVSKIG